MADVCPRCLMTFPAHLVIRARCRKRWRGANFDEAAARGNLGAALAAALGVRTRTTPELEAFLRRVVVRSYGAGLPLNPDDAFDPDDGEPFEFHVGLREEADAARAAELDTVAREAIAKSRNFTLA